MKNSKPFEHNKFVYTENGIEYPVNIKFPNLVFKYYAFGEKSIDAFVNSYLYFSHPNQLNDIVDATDLLLNLEDCSKEDYDGLYKDRISKTNFNGNEVPPYLDAKKDGFIDLRDFIYNYSFFNKGLLSLTTHPCNKLMMAHYTSERGFVLEFEPNKLLNSIGDKNEDKLIHLFPMNYTKTVEKINFFKESKKTIENVNGVNQHILNYKVPFFYLSSVKDKVWSYENEWRIIFEKERMGHIEAPLDFRYAPIENLIKEGRKIKYDSSCLSRIILAPMFFNSKNFQNQQYDSEKNITKYTLNNLKLNEDKMKDFMNSFLNKICSPDYSNKIFLQHINFIDSKYERTIIEILDLNFEDDVISFSYGQEFKCNSET